MAKQCPKNTQHPTKECSFGAMKYDFCTVCKEDVTTIEKEMAKAPVAPVAKDEDEEPELILDPNARPQEDENDQDFQEIAARDEDEEDNFDPFQNPAGYNPNPQRVMGNDAGTHKVVLRNDALTGHVVVMDALVKAFGKSREEAQYIMNRVHFENADIDVFYLNQADWAEISRKIEEVKQYWIGQGCPPQHVNGLTLDIVPR